MMPRPVFPSRPAGATAPNPSTVTIPPAPLVPGVSSFTGLTVYLEYNRPPRGARSLNYISSATPGRLIGRG